MRTALGICTIGMLAIGMLSAVGTLQAAELVGVSSAESGRWQDHLVPLPKEVAIDNKVTVAADRVAIALPAAPAVLIDQAAKELRTCLGQTGTRSGKSDAQFTIELRLVDSGKSELSRHKFADQAYAIRPGPAADSLIIEAIDPCGLYYGAKTLQQLLRPTVTDGNVEIPLARITDWPDMEDRGLWGADNYDHIAWMADRKMNIVEQISDIGVDAVGKAYARLKRGREAMVTEGPQHAVKPVPAILHLEQIGGKGVFQTYPETKGVGSGHEGAICYSQPAFTNVLADWIVELRQLPGVEDVDVWLTENMAGNTGCQCEHCKDEDRSVMEAHVVAAAYKKAKARIAGKLGLRILTSEETEKSNPDVFRALPEEIKIWYYHSLLTYSAGEAPMVRGYLVDFAKQGRWIGMCPNVVNVVHFAGPNTTPQFIHYRMNEFVDKGMSGLIGYATPRLYYSHFLVEATAEWSWNAKGRTPHEFARGWAVRQGMDDPELFAEFADTVGPVAWDVYGSDWPHGEQREMMRVAKKLKEGKLPDLGFALWEVYRSPWGDIKNVEQLERDVEQADRAVELARRLGRDEFIYESLIVRGYIRSLDALWQLKQIVSADGIANGRMADARKWFKVYIDSLERSAELLPKWEATLAMRPAGEDFTSRPIKVIHQVTGEMKQVAADLGCSLDG